MKAGPWMRRAARLLLVHADDGKQRSSAPTVQSTDGSTSAAMLEIGETQVSRVLERTRRRPRVAGGAAAAK